MADMIKDEVFGEVEFEKNIWWRSMDKTLYGSDVVIRVLVQDKNQEGILDVQRKAYQTYLENEEKYIREVPKYILDYYKWNFEEIDRVVELEPGDQKDTITEKALFEMCKVYFLFICRDGSFGWIVGSSWSKIAFAVLLSEQEPRILVTRNELRYLHKMNDDTFGLLTYDGENGWKGLKKHSFFGAEENLVIELEGGVEDTITEAQEKAYAEYLEKEEKYFKAFVEVLRATMVTETALPKTLYIDKEGNYGWICYIPWFDKYTGVLLSEETPIIFKNTNQLLKYSKRNNVLELEDFKNDGKYSHANAFVWGEETSVLVNIKTRSLEEMLPLIQKLIAFLNKEKDAFVKVLIDEGMLKLAEEWVESSGEAEGRTDGRKGYLVDDETVVYLPISEKEFAESLNFDTIDISYDEKEDDISAHIFINCDPDYFADHSIEVYMDSKGNVDVIGLAG